MPPKNLPRRDRSGAERPRGHVPYFEITSQLSRLSPRGMTPGPEQQVQQQSSQPSMTPSVRIFGSSRAQEAESAAFSFVSPQSAPNPEQQTRQQPFQPEVTPGMRLFVSPGPQGDGPRAFSFGSPQTVPATTTSDPTDSIAQATIGMASSFLTPPRERSPAMRIFGTPEHQKPAENPFDFRILHNASPSPTPVSRTRASPRKQPSSKETNSYAAEQETAYNVQLEPPPKNAVFFTPLFQDQLTKGIRVASRVVSEFYTFQMGNGNDMCRRLRDDAMALSTFHATDTRVIALLGDSGEGKSSVINSLLHCDGIAETSDAGMACTSVITEFRQRKPHHVTPYTVEVEYLSESNIEETVKELLWSYSQYYLPEVEKTLNGEGYRKCQEESAVAWATMQAAFDDKSEFKEDLFRDTSDTGQKRALDMLLRWTRDLSWPSGGRDGLWIRTAQSADECREVTRDLMRNRIWPFTKVIRVFLSAQVLKTGIVLADLPGLRDTNLARVRATEKYILKSDHIFIVARISRALTDHSLKSSLYTALTQHIPQEWNDSAGRSLNVSVVCTRTEDIDFTSLKLRFCGPGKRVSEAELQRLEDSIQLAKARESAARTIKLLKRERELLLINARNEFVKEGLRREYAKKVENKSLEVFCVSNKKYGKDCRKGRVRFVQASGIPELRTFCHAINAQAQLEESRNFLLAKLPNFVGSVRLWMENILQTVQDVDQIEEAREKLLAVIAAVRTNIKTGVRCKIQEFKADIQEQILKLIGQCNERWEKEALSRSASWKTWHDTDYNAWCYHNGHHCTDKLGKVNWNSEIIWKMRSELAMQWEVVEDEIPRLFDGVRVIVQKELTKVREALISHKAVSTLTESISTRLDDFTYQAQRAQRETLQSFQLIQRNASEDNYNSYVLRFMLSAYRSASQESGTTKKARQMKWIEGRISNGNLFPSIAVLIDKDLDEFASQAGKTIERLSKEVLTPIRQDVLTTYAVHDSHEASQQEIAAIRAENSITLKLARRLQESLPILEKELHEVEKTLSRLSHGR